MFRLKKLSGKYRISSKKRVGTVSCDIVPYIFVKIFAFIKPNQRLLRLISVTNKKLYEKPKDERKKVTKILERVLGNFDEKSLVKKAIGGIIGAVIVCLSLGVSGNLEEPVLYFFFSFWLAVGIIYGINVIRSIMSACYMTEDFMAKWMVLGVALIIGVITGGILFAIDIVRWGVYLVAKKKEEK